MLLVCLLLEWTEMRDYNRKRGDNSLGTTILPNRRELTLLPLH